MMPAAPILLMLFELKTGRRPQKLEPFWLSLDKAEFRAPAEGIVALRAPIERHVSIAGATFVMGSTELEMQTLSMEMGMMRRGWRWRHRGRKRLLLKIV